MSPASSHPEVDGLPLAALRKRTSEKWSGHSDEILPMPVAEMDFEIAAPVRSALVEMVQRSDTGYMGTNVELAHAFHDFSVSRWGWELDP